MPNQRTPLIASIVFAVVGLASVLVMGKVLFAALLWLVGAGFFVRFRVGPNANVWGRPRVLVAAFVAVVASLVLVKMVPAAVGGFSEIDRLETEMAQAKHTLETMEYDAHGNVVADRGVEFAVAVSESKTLPGNLRTERERLTVSIATSAIAALVLAGCALVIGLATRRRDSAGAVRSAVPLAG